MMEFYTYNGFDFVVPAFERVALLFSANGFRGLFISFAVLGILYAGSAAVFKGFTGNFPPVQAWALPILLGAVVYKAFMFPVTDVAVYDPIKGRNQIVNDVPVGIVMVSGIFNLVERAIVDEVNGSSAYAYKEDGFGISFNLMHSAATRYVDVKDNFLSKTITYYITRCAPIAMASPGTALSDTFIKRGTNDLSEALAQMALPAITTIVFDATNPKKGRVETCQDAWNSSIKQKMSNSNFASVENELCASVGFNVSSSGEIAKCRQRMAYLMQLYGIPEGMYSGTHFVKNIYLAQRFAVALEGDPDLAVLAMANNSTVAEGVGMFVVASQWLPKLRSMMTAIAISIIPILTLFFVTPLASKAIFFLLGMFGWLTLWGATDAILNDMAHSAAVVFWESTKNFGFALDGIARTGHAAAESLALMGKTRTYSISIATALAMALWRFGGYAFSQITDGWAQHLENSGAKAGLQAGTPTGIANTLDEFDRSMSTLGIAARGGITAMANDTFSRRLQSVSGTVSSRKQAQEAGLDANRYFSNLGALHASRDVGDFRGQMEHTNSVGLDSSSISDVTQTATQNAALNTLNKESATSALNKVLTERTPASSDRGTSLLSHHMTNERIDKARTSETKQQLDYLKQTNPEINVNQASSRLAMSEKMATWSDLLSSKGDTFSLLDSNVRQKEMGYAESDSKYETLSEEFDNPGDGAAWLTRHDQQERIAERQNTERIVDKISLNTGQTTSEARSTLAKTKSAYIESTLDATNYEPQSQIDAEASRSRINIAEQESLQDTAARHFDMDPEDIGRVYGAIKAASAAGDMNILDHLSPKQLAAGTFVQGMRNGLFAKNLDESAERQKLRPVDMLDFSAKQDAESSMADMLRLSMIADQLDVDMHEAIFATRGNSGSFAVSGESAMNLIDGLYRHGKIDSNQRSIMEDKVNYGGVWHVSQIMDIANGNIGNIRAYHGSTVNNLRNTVINTGQSISTDSSISDHSIMNAIREPHADGSPEIFKTLFSDWDDNKRLDEDSSMFFSSLTNALEVFGSGSLDDSESSSLSGGLAGTLYTDGNVELDTNNSLLGTVAAAVGGVGLKANLGGRINTNAETSKSSTTTESLHFSDATMKMRDIFEGALRQIDSEINDSRQTTVGSLDAFRRGRLSELVLPKIMDYKDAQRELGQDNLDASNNGVGEGFRNTQEITDMVGDALDFMD